MNPGLPKRVQSAMARQPAGQTHPPADLLNAYAENAVSTAERAQISAHLAVCADCRDIVFLASEAREEETLAAALKTPGRRWRWIAWAAPATAVIVVASVVWLEYPQRSRPEQAHYEYQPQESKRQAPPLPEAQSSNSALAIPPAQHDKVLKRESGAKAEPQPVPAKREPAAIPAPVQTLPELNKAKSAAVAQFSPGVQLNTLQRKGSESNAAQFSQPSPALRRAVPSAPTVEVTGGLNAPPRQYESAADQELKNQKALPSAAKKSDMVALQSNAVDLTAKQGYVAGPIEGTAGLVRVVPAPPPRAHWRITPDGSVEWSAGTLAWNQAFSGQTQKFRVLAVVGSDLWAGGEGGTLLHSFDYGSTWVKVNLSPMALAVNGRRDQRVTGETRVNGTIVSIHFADIVHGELRLDSGEEWITADRGQTWKLK